jgi:hypothetical protein
MTGYFGGSGSTLIAAEKQDVAASCWNSIRSMVM